MKWKKIFVGVLAGLLSAPIGLVLAFIVAVAATAITTRELFPTLLASVTVLPIVMALVLGIPTVVIAFLIGLTLALLTNVTQRFLKTFSAMIGLVMAEIVLSLVLPLIVVPQRDDFTSIISNYFLSGAYGLVLGILTGWFYQRLVRWFA